MSKTFIVLQLILFTSCVTQEIEFYQCLDGKCRLVATFDDIAQCKRHESLWLSYRQLEQNLRPSSTYCK